MVAADSPAPSTRAAEPQSARSGRGQPRPRARALIGAAATLWLPTLPPVLAGPLRECGHCLRTYLLSLPVVPGTLAAVLLRCDGALFFVVSGAITGALLLIAYLLWRELPRAVLIAAVAVLAIAVGAEAFGFAMALRA